MNKYTFRRFIASIITIPLAIAAYWILWYGLVALGAYDNGGFSGGSVCIAFAWVFMWTFWIDIMKKLDA